MARFLRKRRSRLTMPEVSLTPLIDTALTLLIIFMVTTPMMHNAIKINLPEGSAKDTGKDSSDLVVYINEQGSLFFNGLPVTKDNLIPTIKRAMGNDAKKVPVFVKGDKKVIYDEVMKVVNQLREVGGIEYVALATKKT